MNNFDAKERAAPTWPRP